MFAGDGAGGTGGGANGAYGAGVLVGWTERGDRPVFDIVTGVSTGALAAPFAFASTGMALGSASAPIAFGILLGTFLWPQTISPDLELLEKDDPVVGWRERMLPLVA